MKKKTLSTGQMLDIFLSNEKPFIFIYKIQKGKWRVQFQHCDEDKEEIKEILRTHFEFHDKKIMLDILMQPKYKKLYNANTILLLEKLKQNLK